MMKEISRKSIFLQFLHRSRKLGEVLCFDGFNVRVIGDAHVGVVRHELETVLSEGEGARAHVVEGYGLVHDA